jgi:hypothetical protein
MWQDRKGFMGIVQRRALRTSEFFFGDRVAFSASDSGSLRKRTNQSQSLPHFVAKKNSLVHTVHRMNGSLLPMCKSK